MPDFSIGVDLGGTNLRIAAVSSKGQLLEKVTLGTKTAPGRDHVINEMCDAIQRLSEKYKATGMFLGAGIGVPGIIDMQTGMLRKSANLPGWADYPVRAESERRLGAKVVLENDANVAALGEQWLGAARGVPNMAVVTLGTGIGGGIVVAGKTWQGQNGLAGGASAGTSRWSRKANLAAAAIVDALSNMLPPARLFAWPGKRSPAEKRHRWPRPCRRTLNSARNRFTTSPSRVTSKRAVSSAVSDATWEFCWPAWSMF